MKAIVRIGTANRISLLLGGLIIALTCTHSSAFPTLSPVQDLQKQLAETSPDAAPDKMLVSAQQITPEHAPMIVSIGAGQQLFDGDYLCELSDDDPNLLRKQF